MSERLRRVVLYARVSSENQKERQTVLSQIGDVERCLQADPNVALLGRYVDEAYSGPVALSERPEGRRLLMDASERRFDEIWVFNVDRLFRDPADAFATRRELDRYKVKLHSPHENIQSPLEFGLRVLIAGEELRSLIARTTAGTTRAALEGRYCSGIVPLGYKVESVPKPHLVPSDASLWADWTEADCVRRIYDRLALDRWSCRKIADYLNALGVPTAYVKDGRLVSKRKGERKFRTQGTWRPGRIRNLVVNSIYKGEMQYGRRSKDEREIISAPVPALVSSEVWQAAQETLAANRIAAKNTPRVYLFRSLIVCGVCGLHYCGSTGRGIIWYRCDGQLVERGPHEGRCPGKSMKETDLEMPIWADIERYLRDPGDLLDELATEQQLSAAVAVNQAQRVTLEAALNDLTVRRHRLLDLYERASIEVAELEERLASIEQQRREIQQRLDALEPEAFPEVETPINIDELRRRLDQGLTDEQRYEIIHLLVRRIVAHTEFADGRKHARAVVEYKFPAAVVETSTVTGSSPPPA